MTRGWQIALVVGLLGLLVLFYQDCGHPRLIQTVLIGTQAPNFAPGGTSGTLSLDQFKEGRC
jgi:hypothetical protein